MKGKLPKTGESHPHDNHYYDACFEKAFKKRDTHRPIACLNRFEHRRTIAGKSQDETETAARFLARAFPLNAWCSC